jgi:hypothetical protein
MLQLSKEEVVESQRSTLVLKRDSVSIRHSHGSMDSMERPTQIRTELSMRSFIQKVIHWLDKTNGDLKMMDLPSQLLKEVQVKMSGVSKKIPQHHQLPLLQVKKETLQLQLRKEQPKQPTKNQKTHIQNYG